MKKNWKTFIIAFIICVIGGIIGLGVKYLYHSWKFQKLYDSILVEEKEILFLGRPTCGFCNLLKPILDDISKQYHFEYRYINTDELSKKELAKLLEKLEIRTSTFSTPRILITEKDRITDSYIGYMDDISVFHFFKKNGFINEEEAFVDPYPNIERLSSEDYFNLLEERKSTTIIVGRIGDSETNAMLKKANDEKLNVKFLSPGIFLTEEEYNKFIATIKDMKEETLLPLLLEVKNGEVISMKEEANESMLK